MKVAMVTLAWGASLLAGCHSPSLSEYRDHRNFRWEESRTEHFSIYFDRGSTAEAQISRIQQSLENSFTNLLSFLELASNDYSRKPIHVFLVESHEKMELLVGHQQWGGAVPRIRVISAVVNARGNGCSTHEVCHVVANNAWGKPERW